MRIQSIRKPLFLLAVAIAAFLFSSFKLGQADLGIATVESHEEVNFENITIENGLSQGSVRSIFQDRKGFMWFASHDGLNRFDGYKFMIFRHSVADSNSISNNYIYSIGSDCTGDLWIGTISGLNRFDHESQSFKRFYLYNHKGELRENHAIYHVFSSNQPNDPLIYFSTIYGLYSIDIHTYEIQQVVLKTPYAISAKNYIKSSFFDKYGNFWFGMTGSGIIKYNPITHDSQFIPLEKKAVIGQFYTLVNGITDTPDGNILAATHFGLVLIDNLSCSVIQKIEEGDGIVYSNLGTQFNTIFKESEGVYWLGTNGSGVAKYNFNNKSFYYYKTNKDDPNSLLNGNIQSLYIDRSGILWVGTFGDGISRINPHYNKFNLYSRRPGGLNNKGMRTIWTDKGGALWVGGYEGLEKFNRSKNTVEFHREIFTNSGYKFKTIYSSCPDVNDSQRYVWLGSEGGGLYHFDMKTNEYKPYPIAAQFDGHSLIGGYVFSLYQDKTGIVWAGTERGLNRIDIRNQTNTLYEHNPNDPSSIGPKSVYAIYEDRGGVLWIGTDIGGLNSFNRFTGKFTRYTHVIGDSASISSNYVFSILEDSKGRLWVGTNGSGLNLLDRQTNKFQHFTTAEGLPNNVIYSIIEDEHSCLWMSTNFGISRFNTETNVFTNYDSRDGLQSNEFNTASYYKAPDGEIFFGGIKGLNSFYPSRLIQNTTPPPVVLTDFRVLGASVPIGVSAKGKIELNKSISYADTIFLDYTINEFTIEFSALDYASSSKNRYKYTLEGFDKDWIAASPSRTASYTNLDPGIYTFRVLGSNNDGYWNEQGASIVVIINPPFWKTLWFELFSGLFAVSLVVGAYSLRVRAIKKYNRRLEKEVQDRTAELAEANEVLSENAKKLKQLNATKDKFFSIIGHDLKNPLSILITSTEILANPSYELSKEETLEFSNEIHHTSKRLLELLNNLLTWARSQTNKIEYKPRQIELYEITTLTIYLLKPVADDKLITLESEIPAVTYINCDDNMIKTIMRNLVSNAIKFTPEGGRITLSIEEDTQSSDMMVISVQDTGVGIPEAVIDKLFRIDVAVTTSGTKNEKGTGLGLILCREFVERWNGRIWVESTPGLGSCFRFTVPKWTKEG